MEACIFWFRPQKESVSSYLLLMIPLKDRGQQTIKEFLKRPELTVMCCSTDFNLVVERHCVILDGKITVFNWFVWESIWNECQLQICEPWLQMERHWPNSNVMYFSVGDIFFNKAISNENWMGSLKMGLVKDLVGWMVGLSPNSQEREREERSL